MVAASTTSAAFSLVAAVEVRAAVAIGAAVAVVAATTATATLTVEETATVEMDEEEDKNYKIKGFPLSKQVEVVLKRENKFFLGRKEENPKLLGEEFGWFFFRRTISFGVGRIKVGGLNLMMAGTFSQGINNCFFIRSDLARSCH